VRDPRHRDARYQRQQSEATEDGERLAHENGDLHAPMIATPESLA
jgi:hypothetical protein